MPPDLGPDDPAALQAIILAQQQTIARMEASGRALEALIQALELTIARLKRQRYGSCSEKIDREIAQLELALEGLGMAGAAADATPESDELADDEAADDTAVERRLPPRRRGKPRIAADAPRESIILDPGARAVGKVRSRSPRPLVADGLQRPFRARRADRRQGRALFSPNPLGR